MANQTEGHKGLAAPAAKPVEKADEVHIPNFFSEVRQVMGFGGESHLGVGELFINAAGMGALELMVLATTLDNTAGLSADLRLVMGCALALSMAAFLIALSFMRRETFRVFENPNAAAAVCVADAALLALVPVLMHLDVVAGVALACALGIVLGVLLGTMIVFWSYVSTGMYIPDAASCAILGTAAAMVVYATVFTRVPLGIEHIVCALCPLVSAPLLHNRLRDMPVLPEAQGMRSYYERRHAWVLYVYKVALPLLCVGIVIRVYLTYAQKSIMFDLDPIHLVGLFITIAVAGIIANCAIYGVRTGVQSFARFLSVVIPLIALVAAPLSPMPAENLTVVNATLLAAVCLILSLSWTFLCAAAVEYSYAPASTFGLGAGSFALGSVLAEPILQFIPNDNPFFALVIGIVCFFMVFGFLPPRPAPNLSRSTYSRRAAERVNAVVTGAEPDDEAGGAAGGGAGAVAGASAPACANAAAGADGSRADGTVGAPETGAHAGIETQRSGAEPQKGRFVRRCERVAEMYLLSNRETEVLIHLAKGRSMNYIKDALVISEGTAKTHISHVYKKLDVHSRHELVELIESIGVD